ncbi:unnamed protein product [Clonostachys rosea]|uniref:HAUS augmin-like complex subunit 6 N-terminal domain-containing protein n=1 Tax=Bionectria ochroleuca TaxID=29856 RepID=A0ABY6V4X4_BIOOC|nr:unnamed protein product [Clonostachys rosea]
MATAQQTRTRAARLGAAHGNRPLQVPKEFSSAASHVLGTSPTAATSPASSASLFLTNLKLLDLDLVVGWPGISLDTFAAAGAAGAQGQKKRIQCVEWALFHLFALWDPEETANKLKPFFPPLDHVQSLNLRAALLRCLEQAKKNGALGRDAILRKTMLDDCKGERLEDLLAAFSSAVLKKVVSQESAASGEHPPLALSMALENKGYTGDKTELNLLVLAHKASLQRFKRHREVNAAKFRDFADLLGVKERTLVRKKEEARLRAENGSSKTVSDEARLEMWRTLRNNWSGNERWMETLLYGDASIQNDGPFGMPFERMWRRVQQSRLAEVESKDSGLLEQLEGRVNAHKERLEKWQSYRNTMFPQGQVNASPSKRPAPVKSKKGVDFGFNQHDNLTLGRMNPEKRQSGLGGRMTAEYRDMLNGLKKELVNVDQTQPKALLFLQQRRKHGKRISGASDQISEISSLDDDSLDMSPVEETEPSPPLKSKPDPPRRLIRPNLARPNLGFNYPSATSNSESNSVASPNNTEDDYSRRSSNPSTPRARSISSQSPDRVRITNPNDGVITESPTQELADQILESMNHASPSPTKRPKARPRHTLSLAERTRLSMAPRGTSLFLQDDEDQEDDEPTVTLNIPLNNTTEIDPNAEVEDDLISRTRKSMAGFEKARQKAQLERRRSQRKSRAPPPPRESNFPRLEEEEDGMLAQELMAEEDMEAVFRSRPKIQASPLPSPTRELDEWDD